jgi:hypothetical protein
MNFKISVQGEVAAPGTYRPRENYLDCGINHLWKKRNNILIIREIDGGNRITVWISPNADFINSPLLFGTK